jgi:DNA topoisomerase VI subunit A
LLKIILIYALTDLHTHTETHTHTDTHTYTHTHKPLTQTESAPTQVTGFQSDALFILLVEKDAAFMRLAEDRFYNTYPCIIITAKGQPDVASR